MARAPTPANRYTDWFVNSSLAVRRSRLVVGRSSSVVRGVNSVRTFYAKDQRWVEQGLPND
jgi:hypothetical protein